jgi:hypothetical protein
MLTFLSEALDAPDNLVIISAPVVTFIVALLVPIVNGLFTKYSLSGAVKGFITLVMNTVVAFITTNASDTGASVFSMQTLYTAAVGFVISVAMYMGIYKPAKLTSSSLSGKLSPDKGLGS